MPNMTRDWSDSAIHKQRYWKWARRARFVARACRQDRWVCDIGCGMQALRWFLSKETIYLPADLRQWTEDTELCDLNRGQLPERALELCDVAVMIGVLYYVQDPEALFGHLSNYAEFVVFTYNPTDTHPKRKQHWICHMSEIELLGILARQGFGLHYRTQFGPNRRLLMRVRNKRYGDSHRLRREQARSGYVPAKIPNYWWERFRHNLLTMGIY